MSKYTDLIGILDHICAEAPLEYVRYHEKETDEDVLHARSRAYIHLYMQVMFGLMNFTDREKYITDGANDGGIDAYYVDKENRKLYFIQSKFRNTDTNFDHKDISFEELFAMDVKRITEGYEEDDKGNKYRGKILQLQREMQEIPDLARYTYKVYIYSSDISKCWKSCRTFT